ncbi:MAG: lipocalin-like domain-containing protein [Gemmatimonadaceae bacterium]|nr:lipocalin-like domain-containing protein [Gemmatimonadaceae bacterium]
MSAGGAVLHVRRVVMTLGVATAAACGTARGAATHGGVVGSYRVVAVQNRDSVTGQWRDLFGAAPAGYATYAADGTHTLQFTRTPAPTFGARDDRAGTDAELRAAFLGFFAWHGRWRLDAARQVIIHEIEGSLWPSWRNTVQERPYRMRGDTLVLGDTLRARRVFVRVRP